jgi:hypothetical protein
VTRYAVLYTNKRVGLDEVIEADSYRADGKFFTFLKSKEVVRSLKLDIVVQIKRLDDEEDGDQSEEGDLDAPSKPPLTDLGQDDAALTDELLAASSLGKQELDELLAASSLGKQELDELLASASLSSKELDELLASMPGTQELDELLADNQKAFEARTNTDEECR